MSFEQQMELYRLLVEHSLGLMCIHDLDGVLLTINPAAAASLGYSMEESIGRNIREFLAPSVQHLFDKYLERIRRNKADNGLMRLIARGGSERIWLYRNVLYEGTDPPVRVLGQALDITERIAAEQAFRQSQAELAKARDDLELRVAERTAELQSANKRLQAEMEERKQVEEELLRARKLEALGGFAGGIAHDFNNLMTIVGGYCDLLQTSLTGNRILQEHAREIRKASEQANSLTRQLLAFSRRQSIQPSVLNLGDVLQDMSNMLHRLLRDDIELSILTDSCVGAVRCDRGQIEQVIMNLAINAADAMPKGGKLVLGVTNICLEQHDARLHPGMHPGSYTRLTVADTGSGMDSETKARIFEPFFTTKEQGKGTGLGLATVYGVVKQAGAHIFVDSEPGKGTTFHLYFPHVEESASHEFMDRPAAQQLANGSETVLVVDDQEGLRTLLTEVLRKSGYRVLTAINGRDALRYARQHTGRIDLVITDVVMPRMGGLELARAVSELRPETRVLCMSGYSDRVREVDDLLARGHEFIEKPFSTEALLSKVRKVLNESAASPGYDSTRKVG